MTLVSTALLAPTLGIIAAICLRTSPGREAQPAPDIILFDGKVFTADSTQPWAEAVAIAEGRIQLVSTSAAVLATAGPATRRINVGGRVIIPGLNDAHDHPLFAPPVGFYFRTSGSPTPDPTLSHVIDSLRVIARRAPQGSWLRTEIGPRIVRDTVDFRSVLDSVTPDHPVLLWGWWGHGTIMNSNGLRAVGISEDARDPLGGWYERAASGRLNGKLQEYAAWAAVRKLYVTVPESTLVRLLVDYTTQKLRFGITTVQYMAAFPDPAVLSRVLQVQRLPIRLRLVRWPMPEGSTPSDPAMTPQSPPNSHVTISGTKWVVDGTPIEQLAFRRTPYPNREWRGRMNLPVNIIRAILTNALNTKEPLHLHIVGDSTTAVVLSLMEEVGAPAQWRPMRVRFEHANGVTRNEVERARRLGVIIAQPRAGAPLRTWRNAGIPLAYGSDTSPNPFADLAAAASGAGNAAEALSREEAVQMYTTGSAFAEFTELQKGSLTAGKVADLAVLANDIFVVPANELSSTTSVLTLVGGQLVYDAGVLQISNHEHKSYTRSHVSKARLESITGKLRS